MSSRISLEFGPRVPDGALNLAWVSFPSAGPHNNVIISNVSKSLPSSLQDYERIVPYEEATSYTRQIRDTNGAVAATNTHKDSVVGRFHSPITVQSAYLDASGAWRPQITDGVVHADFMYAGACKEDTVNNEPVVTQMDPSWLSQIRVPITGTASFTTNSSIVYVTGGSANDVEVGDYIDAGALGDWYVLSVTDDPNNNRYILTIRTWTLNQPSSGTASISRRLRKGQLLHAIYTIPEYCIGEATGNYAISFQERATVIDSRSVKVASPRITSVIDISVNGAPLDTAAVSADGVTIGYGGVLALPVDVAISDTVLVTYYYLEPTIVYNGYYETLSDGTKVYHDLDLNPEYGHTYDNGRDTAELLGYMTTLFMIPSAIEITDELADGIIATYRACDFGETQLLRWTSRQIKTLYNIHEYIPWPAPPWTECVITVTPSSKTLNGGEQCEFTAVVVDGVDPSVKWYVENSDVTFSGSVIQYPRHGRTTKCLYTAPNVTGSYNLVCEHKHMTNKRVIVPITVVAHADDEIYVAWTLSQNTVRAGETVAFAAVSRNSTDSTVTYSLDGGSVGELDESGNYTAPATFGGTATITATSVEDPTATASVTVTIVSGVTGVSISAPNVTVVAGGTIEISAEALSASGFTLPDKTVTWAIVEGEQGGSLSDAGPSSSSTYTAPTDPAYNNQVYTVRATSNLDSAYSADLFITVGNPTTSSPIRPAPDTRAGYYGSARYNEHRFIQIVGPRPPEDQ